MAGAATAMAGPAGEGPLSVDYTAPQAERDVTLEVTKHRDDGDGSGVAPAVAYTVQQVLFASGGPVDIFSEAGYRAATALTPATVQRGVNDGTVTLGPPVTVRVHGQAATFEHLVPGAYLVTETDAQGNPATSATASVPFVVVAPALDPADGRWAYTVIAEPKNAVTAPPTTAPPTTAPTAPAPAGGTANGGGRVVLERSQDVTGVTTGLLRTAVLLGSAAAVACAVLLYTGRRARREG
jgi:hypothetical protein